MRNMTYLSKSWDIRISQIFKDGARIFGRLFGSFEVKPG